MEGSWEVPWKVRSRAQCAPYPVLLRGTQSADALGERALPRVHLEGLDSLKDILHQPHTLVS